MEKLGYKLNPVGESTYPTVKSGPSRLSYNSERMARSSCKDTLTKTYHGKNKSLRPTLKA